MIQFLIRKMWKNKWMVLSLLIGNILLVGIVASTPLYTQATMQRILQKDLQSYQLQNNVHPALSQLHYTFNYVTPDKRIEAYEQTRDRRVGEALNALAVEPLRVVRRYTMDNWYVVPAVPREEKPRTRTLNLTSFQEYEDHINLVQGRMPSAALADGNVIEVLANENTMVRQDLLLNELNTLTTPALEGKYFIRVVGIYEVSDAEDLYWTSNPNMFSDILLMPEELITEHFIPNYQTDFRVTASWLIMLDYTQMNAADVPLYVAIDDALKSSFNSNVHIWEYEENFIDTLDGYTQRTDKLVMTLWVLQVPIYVLLAFYIFMVSRQILTLEQNDISVLKSRGASRRQIFAIYLTQSLIIAAVSLLLGIPLGVMVCRMLGASSGFLGLVQRAALSVELNADAFIYAGIAAFLSILTMLGPVIRFSRVTIVDYKRNKSGKPKKALWQRFFLDFLCFGVSLYGLYNFNNQRELMMTAIVDVQAVDPLLYISASLFIIGLGLICLRIFPYLVRLVFLAGRKIWSPSLYASLLKVIRSAGEEQFIMIFLVFTLAVGIFDAKSARTININNDQKIQYTTGADLVFAEMWRDNQVPAGMSGESESKPIVYYEPDFERFTGFAELDSIAKVMIKSRMQVSKTNSSVEDVTLMAVDTNTFGNTVWYRDDLLPTHINHFLNVLAQRSDGVLLSYNFKELYGYEIGDSIVYRDSSNADVESRGIVYGFVEHWPGYSPKVTVTDEGGARVQEDSFLVVANLGYLTNIWGVHPYQVWMKTNSPTNNFFHEFRDQNELRLTEFKDAKGLVVESKSDPILQGTNGVLTVGFIVTLLVCFTGFLIYWILSIKSRVLQFGIFRAMGMTMRNIIGLLINEQLFITLTAVVIGGVVGEVSSRLFVPLIQISFSASEQVIPLRIITESRDYGNLFTTIGVMIALCLIILGIIISRIRIAQALKLGED